MSVHVDREQERALFKSMIERTTPKHIFLIQAEPGMGKTSLLKDFWSQCEALERAQVNLRNMSYSVGEILSELSLQLGVDKFENFYNYCREFAREAGITIEGSTFIGSALEATLGQLDPEKRRMQRQIFTDSFFADLVANHENSQQPVVFLFDTLNKNTSDEIKEWLQGLFLNRVRRHQWIVAVVAGQEVPQLDGEWEEWSSRQDLSPLNEDNVREYLQRLEISMSDDWVEALYFFTKGNPQILRTKVDEWRQTRGARHG
jgi:hypothetical protein